MISPPLLLAAAAAAFPPAADLAALSPDDPRNIASGRVIPSEGYCDQPYAVVLPDGAWLLTMTTGRGKEGEAGQHVVAVRSTDGGRTWSDPVDIEPADGPAASWAVPLLSPPGSARPGRVFVFYTYNAAGLDRVATENGTTARVDTLGEYAARYTDDGGRTWSDRWFLPVRAGAIDRGNPYGGAVRFFWGVGRPALLPPAGGSAGDGGGGPGAVLLPFAKVGRFGRGFMAQSEAWFLRSDDLLTTPDPTAATWVTLPEGDRGLTAPAGPIAEEPSVAALSDGSLLCVYRTVAGSPGVAYSRDRGRTWTPPAFLRREPGGDRVRHPRAANFVWKLSRGPHAGKYLHWFHAHGGTGYAGRNPAHLAGGVERPTPDGPVVVRGEPEVALFSPDPAVRISDPDLIEDPARGTFLTETQKTVARVHPLDPALLDRLFAGS